MKLNENNIKRADYEEDFFKECIRTYTIMYPKLSEEQVEADVKDIIAFGKETLRPVEHLFDWVRWVEAYTSCWNKIARVGGPLDHEYLNQKRYIAIADKYRGYRWQFIDDKFFGGRNRVGYAMVYSDLTRTNHQPSAKRC